MPRMKKTVLHLEVNEKEWTLKSNLSLDYPQITDKIAFKHDERIMRALMSDDKLFRLFYRLVEPVLRCKRRDARRAAKKECTGNNQVITPLNPGNNQVEV